MSLAIILVQFTVLIHSTNRSRTIVFVMNFITVVPLDALLSDGTEQIVLYFREIVGGLLNSSFG